MENQRGSSDGEDIPSDFFDDFNKEEFMEGLSVIDSWDDEDKKTHGSRARINLAVDNVRDLRELIVRQDDDTRDDRLKWRRNKSPSHNKQSSRHRLDSDHLDDYIKPGSRRDPNKTNEAIRRDKEVKVKEYLAKHLESGSDLCPPGTELEDFFEDHKSVEVRKHLSVNKSGDISPAKEHRPKHVRYSEDSPMRRRETPPRYRRTQGSPRRPPHSPHRRPNLWYHSPYKNVRKYHKYSPRRVSPEFRRDRRSRSPYKRFRHQSRSHSPVHRFERGREERHQSRSSNNKSERDDFLYPKGYLPPPEYSSIKTEIPYHQVEPGPQYTNPVPIEYGNAPNYSYTQVQGYSGYGIPYEYGTQPTPLMVMPVPQPVPAPNISSTSSDPSLFNPGQPPPIIPSQHIVLPAITNQSTIQNVPETMQSAQIDALAKLVADGKLSHEDYLKLAPSKGLCQAMDTHARVAVLNRCHDALSRLGNIMVPNQLLINNSLIGPEQKQLAPKFCSPLKRQAAMDFHFTKYDSSVVSRQNKLIVDSIIATLDIEKVVGKSKKKIQKDTKDAAVQTTKPFCEVCEIRESTKFTNAETSIDREQFLSTVHTQVVEQDLVSSKSMFNPTGGKVEGANISIAHMTPAQLVSQLAARAKTLKQTEPAHSSSQFRHTQGFDYDDRGSDKQYRNHYNYRY